MKKLTLIIIFLLLSTTVLAQDFSINLVSYDPETGNARIQITNLVSKDFHDLRMNIDNIIEKKLADFFKAGSSFSTFTTLPPGEHEITLTTIEGITLTKKLDFSPNEEQMKEITKRNIAEERLRIADLPKPPQKEFNYNYIYIPLILILIIILIYLLYKKSRHYKKYKK